jgi:predicted SAM-dependent methyltransferase
LRRRRERREERARVQKALADLAAAFRVPAESTTPANFAIGTAPPSGFATVLRIDDLFVGTNDPKWRDPQLHLGSGPQAIEGWINIDNLPYPGVDLIWDLARGIPFREARYIFAEHFIEHLSYAQAEQLVRNCRAALRDDGILRLSTPNLDWVMRTSYVSGDPLHDCFNINRAFHGWGHQFLYNLPALENLLQHAGFETIRSFAWGESDTPALRDIERHERYPDSPALPHMVIVEASGRRTSPPPAPHPMIDEYRRDIVVR